MRSLSPWRAVCLVTLLLVAAVPPVAAKGARRALLVGVWSYERGGGAGWRNLGSANDVAALKQVLVRKMGFTESEVMVLSTPAETTHRAIVEAFQQRLIVPAKTGDQIFFHYSGHGSQVPDERELDGLAETLVPSDYKSLTDGANDIRDKELAALLGALAAKGVTDVTLSFDCCHSGTITRSQRAGVRGAAYAGAGAHRGNASAAPDGASGMLASSEARRFVVLSACRADELAGQRFDGEGQVVGLYSAALVEALGQATPTTTWLALYESVRERLAAEPQTPQIEGAVDRLVFGGAAIATPSYIPVYADGKAVILEAGRLQGVAAGTLVDLYGPGTTDFRGKPLARAEVDEVGLGTSTLRVAGAAGEQLAAARARIVRQAFADTRLRVDVRALRGTTAAGPVTRVLRTLPLVAVEEGDGGDLAIAMAADELRLERRDGTALATVSLSSDGPDALRASLEAEARRRYVAALSNDAPEAIPVRMRLVAVEPRMEEGRPVGEARVLRPVDARAPLQAGTWVRVEVWNAGYQEAYLSLLDVMQDGAVTVLWPPPGRARADDAKMLNSVDEKWVPIPDLLIRLTPTRGKETLKLIATDRPVRFGPVLDGDVARQVKRAAFTHPLARCLLDLTLGLRSGRDAIEPATWGTASVTITVR